MEFSVCDLIVRRPTLTSDVAITQVQLHIASKNRSKMITRQKDINLNFFYETHCDKLQVIES